MKTENLFSRKRGKPEEGLEDASDFLRHVLSVKPKPKPKFRRNPTKAELNERWKASKRGGRWVVESQGSD